MKEERSGGEPFYSSFITVYSMLTVATAAWMDTHTQGLTGDALYLSEPSFLAGKIKIIKAGGKK